MPPQSALVGNGIGLRTRHYREFLDTAVKIDWLEVHSENYFGEGGFDLYVLDELAKRYPISLHGVGLGIGAANGISELHLRKLKRLVERIQPALVSEHLSWNSTAGRYLNDLLPLTLSYAALDLVCDRVDYIQNYLQRPISIENVSTYLRYTGDAMSETAFLIALSKRTGCGILLDVNNLYVNQCNHQESAVDAILQFAQLPQNIISEVHLAGHTKLDHCVIDDHGSCVDREVWDLYLRLCQDVSSTIPTLIEWDTNVPELAVLLNEAAKIEMHRHSSRVES